MSASMKGYTAIVNVLLQAGADEEAKKEEVSLLWFTTEKYCRFRVDEVGTLISTVEKICAVFIALISPPPPPLLCVACCVPCSSEPSEKYTSSAPFLVYHSLVPLLQFVVVWHNRAHLCLKTWQHRHCETPP